MTNLTKEEKRIISSMSGLIKEPAEYQGEMQVFRRNLSENDLLDDSVVDDFEDLKMNKSCSDIDFNKRLDSQTTTSDYCDYLSDIDFNYMSISENSNEKCLVNLNQNRILNDSLSKLNNNLSKINETSGEDSAELLEKKVRKHKNSIKLVQSARLSSSSVLSIDRFRRIKSKRRSSSSQTSDRKIIYSKNLLYQIEGLHVQDKKEEIAEKEDNYNLVSNKSELNSNKILDILVDIYNTELSYLNLLKKAFDIYAEPIRKFTSLTHDEYNTIFGYLEPIISLSYNLSIKLENLIKLWPCDIIGNSGKLFGKKLFQSYEEYLAKYPSIIKLLNQNELKDLCEIRQTNSNCQLSLKHILSAPLERIQYYEKSLQYLSNQEDSELAQLNCTTNTKFSKRESNRISFISTNLRLSTNALNQTNNSSDANLNINLNEDSLSTTTNRTTTRLNNKSYLLNNNDISSPSLIYWQKMKDKSQSLINLNNQMNDLDRSKLNNLASIQRTFPNDDLNLFETGKKETCCSPASKQQQQQLQTTPIIASNKAKSAGNSNKHLTIDKTNTNVSTNPNLFGSNLELSSTGNSNLILNNLNNNESNKCTARINRTPTISIVPKTPLKTKTQQQQQNTCTSTSGGGVVSSTKASFVSKHLLIQRRKTIHDIINLDILSNLINNNNNQQQENNSTTNQPKIKKKLSSSSILSVKPKIDSSPTDYLFSNLPLVSRELVKQGNVQLLNQYGKQDRYLFLFNDLLIIAKQKNEHHNKLKYRVLLSEIWLSDCFDTIYWQYKADTSIVIGWPPATNYIADFKDVSTKEAWLQKLKELIAIEKQKEEGLHLNIKISYNTDNLGGSEPTQYSQCYTKTVQIKSNESAQEIVNRCKYLFNLDTSTDDSSSSSYTSSNNNTSTHSSTASTYQLWLKTNKNEPLIPLIGHEYPFAIKMNFLHETGRSLEEDDNSYKFILIDKNSRLKKQLQQQQQKQQQQQLQQHTLLNSQKENLKQNEISSTDSVGLQKLRKKMFWNKSSNARTLLVSSNQNLAALNAHKSSLSTEKKLKETLNLANQTNSTRSSSVHLVDSKYLTNSKTMVSTLKPFYNKLKKSHLFGTKLEKLCGAYSATNNQLPSQIMSLLEKVSTEGAGALMIFRKSASAKLKKTLKDKIDSNQTVDYTEMNVHVAALLLKEYLRDYPDGIIDYHLYSDCINLLKQTDQNLKLKNAKIILAKMPKWNFVCLKHFMCLFNCITSNSSVNKMDMHNLAVCVAPSIFHKLDRPNDVESSFKAISFVEYLMQNTEALFGADTFSLLSKKAEKSNQIDEISKSNESIKTNSKLFSLVKTKSKLKSKFLNTSKQIIASQEEESFRRRTSTNNSQDNFVFEDFDDEVYYDDSEDDDDDDIIVKDKISNQSDPQLKRNLFKLNKNNSSSKLTQKQQQQQQHDLSSNTLSVDSGLSVPTATNSDPESEKNANTENTKQEPQTAQNNYLKRQKRMLNLENLNNSESFSSLHKKKAPILTLETNHKKSVAPLAPHLQTDKSTLTIKKSKKSIVKINFDRTVPINLYYNGISTGLGEASDNLSQKNFTSTVYVSYSRKKEDLNSSSFSMTSSEELNSSDVDLNSQKSRFTKIISNHLNDDQVVIKPPVVKDLEETNSNTNPKPEQNTRFISKVYQEECNNRIYLPSKPRISMDNNNNNNQNSNKNVIVNDLNLAGVTWSVLNIRKQFESKSRASLNSNPELNFNSLRSNRSSLGAKHIQMYHQAYKDINGNPTTYI